MFQHKWLTENGENATLQNPVFARWCQELKHFTPKEWGRAYARIESDVKQAARQGDDLWPPSSVAVIAYSEPPVNSGMYRRFKPLGIEDKTAKEKRKELGRKEISKIKALLGD